MTDVLDLPNICMEDMGHLYPGDIRLSSSALSYKNKSSGKVTVVQTDEISTVDTTYLANKPGLRILTKDGDLYRFGRFDSSAFEKLKTYIATKWKQEIGQIDTAIKGWNYGETEIVGKNLQFKVNGLPAFEIPLSNVSNCSSNKNEAIIEFHGNDDCAVGLVEMRFHIPQPEGGADEEMASELFREKIMQFADVEMETEQPIVLLTGMPCITPRGRYDIKVFPTFLSFHGKTYDYKILSKSVSRLFLLPHKDKRRVYFVMHINPPIRQGQTRYSYIVFEFNNDEMAELELSLTEDQIKNQYEGKIEKNLSGALYQIVVKLFRVFVGIKVTVPPKAENGEESNAVNCSHKQSHGLLYPMEKGFMYVPKPPIYIRFEEISTINFARSDVTTKTFDLEISVKSGGSYTFNSVAKDDFDPLLNFCKGKNLPVTDIKNLKSRPQVPISIDDVDPYKERLMADAAGSDGSDSDEEDEDFDVEAELTKKKKKQAEDSEATDGSEPSEEYDTMSGEDDDTPKEKKSKKSKEKKDKKSKHKEDKKKKDPNAPKRAQTAYFLWMNENRSKITKAGMNVAEVAKEGGALWKAMSESEKKPWEEKAKKDKERYEKEIAEYKASGGASKKSASPKKPSSQTQKSPSKAKSKEFVSSSSDSDSTEESEQEKKKSKSGAKGSSKAAGKGKKEEKKKTPSSSEEESEDAVSFYPFACCSSTEAIEDSQEQSPQKPQQEVHVYPEREVQNYSVRVKSTSTPPSGLAPIASPDLEEEVRVKKIKVVNAEASMGDIEEPVKKVQIKQDEFSGLIGNLAGNLLSGGGGGNNLIGGLASNILGGE
ncbi:hypothetical protein FO519_002613 [Halicephalobus sp. NKZ332]|nr:hypothetical protein FO519_002613 [Halicephalobus sp. NKZ332]